ncbi:MAG: hypothetical protein ACJ8LG_18135 [Massilia sp.]
MEHVDPVLKDAIAARQEGRYDDALRLLAGLFGQAGPSGCPRSLVGMPSWPCPPLWKQAILRWPSVTCLTRWASSSTRSSHAGQAC